MDRLRKRLETSGVWSDRLEAELKALWKYGIYAISDAALRETTARFLEIVPRIFFTDHASRSGRHHPPWQNGLHGTLRSIVESCLLVPSMAQYIPELLGPDKKPVARFVDAALAATVISDTWKKEDAGDVHHGPAHGRVVAEKWRVFAASAGLDPALAEEVAQGAHWHFGVYAPDWGPGTVIPPVAWLVHLCDAFTAQTVLAKMYDGKVRIE